MVLKFSALGSLIFLVVFLRVPHALAEPTIEVRSQTELGSQAVITVGDIANFSGFAEDEIRTLKTVRLGDAPGNGEVRTFTNLGLSQILRSHLQDVQEAMKEKIVLLIPSQVKISKRVLKIEQKAVEAEMRKQLKSLCDDCEFDIASLSMPAIASDMPANSTWKISLKAHLPKGSFSVPLEIQGENNLHRMYWISGVLQVRKLVPVAKRLLNTDEKLQTDDIAFEMRDITYLSDTPANQEDLKSAYMARGIAADQIIARSFLRRESAMRFGENVKVVAGNQDWQVSVEGIAQQNAYIGDTVKVKISRSQKMVSGVLVSKGTVEVGGLQ
jgi:flagella basal body P-ring formation protein FlgA